MGSDDGRFFIFAFKIDYVQPPAAEDDEFSGDDETQDDQVIKFSALEIQWKPLYVITVIVISRLL
jgi:hypothetical protein